MRYTRSVGPNDGCACSLFLLPRLHFSLQRSELSDGLTPIGVSVVFIVIEFMQRINSMRRTILPIVCEDRLVKEFPITAFAFMGIFAWCVHFRPVVQPLASMSGPQGIPVGFLSGRPNGRIFDDVTFGSPTALSIPIEWSCIFVSHHGKIFTHFLIFPL